MNKYARQDRGGLSDYEAYFAGMDASMQQKIALTTAHFPSRGRIADMGSGSGSGTRDLARLYRHLSLVGVDINPVTVEYSNNHFQAENLKFVVGDIAGPVFPENSLDGILDSSVLHHVTSFNGYDAQQISKTLKNQVAQLKPGGVLIIRDFVVPDGAETTVYLDLPTGDGAGAGDIPALSSAALFEIFARDFRSSRNMNGPVFYEKRPCPRPGFARFETTLRTAAEFVLRKDYRRDWAPELIEEYTYFSQDDFEQAFKSLNLRIVVSMPLWNPWIVENRFRNKFYLSDRDGNELTYPPTNYLIVGEKVGPGEGVQLSESTVPACGGEKRFLSLNAYRHKTSGQVYELAERPNRTIDLLPWFEAENGQLFVVAKKGFPRPIVNAAAGVKNLNRANYSGYLTEPVSAIVEGPEEEHAAADHQKNGGAASRSLSPHLRAEIGRVLSERAALSAGEILEISPPAVYYTSPGGIDERVEAFLVKINEWQRGPIAVENYTPFAGAGVVRELDALQVLRASHVGGMFDARLEIGIYRLLRRLNRSASAWIGAAVRPEPQTAPHDFSPAAVSALDAERVEVFERIDLAEISFLKLERSEFVEYDAQGVVLSRAEFEYVVPEKLSRNTVAAIPFFQTGDGVFVGVEWRDLPAPQRFSGSARLACVPAWRLPLSIRHRFDLEPFLAEKFPAEFAVRLRKAWELGGSYLTSAGITPELVYPLAVELAAEDSGKTDLQFFHLKDLLENFEKIQDAHLLILLGRLGHALGF